MLTTAPCFGQQGSAPGTPVQCTASGSHAHKGLFDVNQEQKCSCIHPAALLDAQAASIARPQNHIPVLHKTVSNLQSLEANPQPLSPPLDAQTPPEAPPTVQHEVRFSLFLDTISGQQLLLVTQREWEQPTMDEMAERVSSAAVGLLEVVFPKHVM